MTTLGYPQIQSRPVPDLFQKATGGTPPATPTNLTVDPSGINSANTSTWFTVLQWQASDTPTNFEVWRKEVSNGDVYHLIATISGAVTTYTDDTRPPAMPSLDLWTYKVRGKNGGTFGSFSNETQIANGIDFNNTGETSLSYPILVLSFFDINLQDLGSCTSLSFPKLKRTVLEFFILNFPVLTSVDVSALENYGGEIQDEFSLFNCPGMTSLNFAACVFWGGAFTTQDSQNLVSISINPAAVVTDSQSFNCGNCAFNAATVNALLALGVANNLTQAFIDLSGGTNAAPTGQGILDKATLIANGCTVQTN